VENGEGTIDRDEVECLIANAIYKVCPQRNMESEWYADRMVEPDERIHCS
jgi:hypothetical protein